MSLPPPLQARVDQVHAHTGETLDRLVAMARDMTTVGPDPAEQIVLITLALVDVQDLSVANLAGLAATAILRLAEQQPGGSG